ncbi:MAG: NUDIX domain-containing protein [Ancalomicrobiaceae bacterium]|nr:NUDIX domain-containing protein [Ancalomicrobiaceae bacterium]
MNPSPRRLRHSARVLVLDPVGAVLLIRFAMPDGRRFWALPGGEIEPGESPRAAARRELYEEAGLELALSADPVDRVRDVMTLYDGEVVDAEETIFLAHASDRRASFAASTEIELSVLKEHRWWSLGELRLTAETVYPMNLAELLASLTGQAAEPSPRLP